MSETQTENITTAQNRDVESDFFIQPTPEQQIKHNHLLVIAVDHYEDEDIPNLTNCIRDAEAVIQVLTDGYFFNRENIYFLRSRNRDMVQDEATLADLAEEERKINRFAYVGEADHRNIVAQIKKLATQFQKKLKDARKEDDKAQAQDNIILMYSGHGIYDVVLDEGYWIPTDGVKDDNATYIENSTIRTMFRAMKTHHSVLISDSCYSGTLFSSGATRNLTIPRVYKYPSRWGLTAGRKNQTVSDGIRNSPFAEKMIEILKRKHEVWISDLGTEIIKEIGESETQTPMSRPLANIDGDDGGQFVFLPRLVSESDFWRVAWQENTRKGYYTFLARFPDGEYEKIALAALDMLASGEKPVFSPAALKTFDILLEHMSTLVKPYLLKFIHQQTDAVLEAEAEDTYNFLVKEAPQLIPVYLSEFTRKAHRTPTVGAAVKKTYSSFKALLSTQADAYLRDFILGKTRVVITENIRKTYQIMSDHFSESVPKYLKELSKGTSLMTISDDELTQYQEKANASQRQADAYLKEVVMKRAKPGAFEMERYRREILGFPNSYAFLVGISEYPNLEDSDLDHAESDIRQVGGVLKEKQGFNHVEYLLGTEADLEGIRDLLKRIQNPDIEPSIAAEDCLLFYFSGQSLTGTDRKASAYLMPSDFAAGSGDTNYNKLIPMEDLYQTLKAVGCQHTLVVLDCEDGDSFRSIANSTR